MTARSWRVVLSDDERSLLEEVVSSGRGAARRIRRARILLDLDEGRDEGLLTQREAAERSGVESKVTGGVEARVIALACSQPPEGYGRWSLRLLERRIASTDGIPNLDHSTIGRILKKRGFALT